MPFEQYYRQHFRSIGAASQASIHAAFPRRVVIQPQPLDPQEGYKLSEDEAAMRIQAIHRGKVVRQTRQKEEDAAVRIQAIHRGKTARQAMQKEASGTPEAAATSSAQEASDQAHAAAEEAAAVRIQALHRGKTTRQALQKEPLAASTAASPPEEQARCAAPVVAVPAALILPGVAQAQAPLLVSAQTVLGPAFGSFNMPNTFLLA